MKVFMQQEQSDCGICCLETIIDYYKGYIPLETLRIETSTTENGTNAYNLIECAKKYGFNCKGIKVKDLNKIKSPVIAHLKLNNIYHFVVIYKIKNNFIYIVDPAIGKIKYTQEKFYEMFTGIILEFVPCTKIPKLKKNKYLNNLLKIELKKNKIIVIKVLILNLIIILLSLLISLEVKMLYNNKSYFIVFLNIIIFNELFIFLKNKYIILINTKINNNLVTKFIKYIFKLPSKYLTLKNNGEIITRFNEINHLSNNIITLSINIIFNLILIINIIIVFIFINIYIGLFIIILCIFLLTINYYLYKKIYPLIINSVKSEENYKGIILDYINKIDTIKNIKKYSYFIENISRNNNNKNKKSYNLNIKINKLLSIKGVFLNIFNLLFIFIIIRYNTIKDSLLLIVLFNYLISIINTLIECFPIIFYIKSIFYKTSEFMSINYKTSNKNIQKFKKITIINFKNNYVHKPQKKLNIIIYEKDKILIKGISGIGKSSLMKTLTKINEEYDGNIYIDNNNIKNINIDSLISYTSQNDSLFYDTIKNNILLNRNIESVKLNDILNITRINEIQIVKENGLDSLLLNNTFNISGGEKNRIILARSLLTSKKIIILDEVLSQVDYKLEIDIIKDILKYFKDKTIIYISHRNVSNLFNKVIDLNERSINGIN